MGANHSWEEWFFPLSGVFFHAEGAQRCKNCSVFLLFYLLHLGGDWGSGVNDAVVKFRKNKLIVLGSVPLFLLEWIAHLNISTSLVLLHITEDHLSIRRPAVVPDTCVSLLLEYNTGKCINLKIYAPSVIKIIRLVPLSFSQFIHNSDRERDNSFLDSTASTSFSFGDD